MVRFPSSRGTSTSTTTTTSTSTSTSSTSTSSTWTSAVNGSNATSTTASASPVEDSSSNETSTLTSTVFSNATTTTMIDLPENVSENVSSYNTSDRRLAEAWRIEESARGERGRAGPPLNWSTLDLPEEAVMINVFWGMIVENKSSGLLRLVKTPGLFFPEAYEVLREWRPAKLIDELSYAAIKDTLTGEITVRPGPTLVMLEAYEELLMIGSKVVIKKDEYLRLIDQRTGHERVVLGPGAVSPGYEDRAGHRREEVQVIEVRM
eukprot:g27308.t1